MTQSECNSEFHNHGSSDRNTGVEISLHDVT